MKVRKWVDMGQEVTIEIDVNDIMAALSEAFENVTQDRLGEEGPNQRDVTCALNCIARFLNALTYKHIGLMDKAQRDLVAQFLKDAAGRFEVPTA